MREGHLPNDVRGRANDLNIFSLPAGIVEPKGLSLALDLDHVRVRIPLNVGGRLLTGRRR